MWLILKEQVIKLPWIVKPRSNSRMWQVQMCVAMTLNCLSRLKQSVYNLLTLRLTLLSKAHMIRALDQGKDVNWHKVLTGQAISIVDHGRGGWSMVLAYAFTLMEQFTKELGPTANGVAVWATECSGLKMVRSCLVSSLERKESWRTYSGHRLSIRVGIYTRVCS